MVLVDAVNDWLKNATGDAHVKLDDDGLANIRSGDQHVWLKADAVTNRLHLMCVLGYAPSEHADAVMRHCLQLNLMSLLPEGAGLGMSPTTDEIILVASFPGATLETQDLQSVLDRFAGDATQIAEGLRDLLTAAPAEADGSGDAAQFLRV